MVSGMLMLSGFGSKNCIAGGQIQSWCANADQLTYRTLRDYGWFPFMTFRTKHESTAAADMMASIVSQALRQQVKESVATETI